MDLEQEIEHETSRIESKVSENESKVDSLESKISTFNCIAWTMIGFGFLVAIIGICFYTHKPSEYGLNLLGDFYAGSVASIWSLAGLFFIYVAFLGQRQQLLSQQIEILYSRLEVKHTRLELKGQKEEMKIQNSTLLQQRFESTFFQLLRNHQDIVNGIDIRVKNNRVGDWTVSSQGRDCFKVFYERFKRETGNCEGIDEYLDVYMNFYFKHQADLGHYFRNLYHILKYVDNAIEIDKESKFTYTSLLRALLSSYELSLIFYNGLGRYGKDYFRPLIEKYSFLKNVDDTLLLKMQHKSEYKKLAFASSKERNKRNGTNI